MWTSWPLPSNGSHEAHDEEVHEAPDDDDDGTLTILWPMGTLLPTTATNDALGSGLMWSYDDELWNEAMEIHATMPSMPSMRSMWTMLRP